MGHPEEASPIGAARQGYRVIGEPETHEYFLLTGGPSYLTIRYSNIASQQ